MLVRMKYKEFVKRYNIKFASKVGVEDDYLESLPYDTIHTDDDGNTLRCIEVELSDNSLEYIPLLDILGSSKEEFKVKYPRPEELEAYDRYLDNVIILTGEDLYYGLQKRVKEDLKLLSAVTTKVDDWSL